MPLSRALPFAVLAVAAVVITGGVVALTSADQDEGVVHWSDAVTSSRRARTITVSADVQSIAGSSGCGALRGVPTTRESDSRIVITVDVVEHPAPIGTACGAGLVAAIAVQVHLRSPVSDRRLIDGSTGDRHVALVASAGPTLRSVPAGFTPRQVQWDESRGIAFRWWRNAHDQQIDLTVGPTAAVMQQQRVPRPSSSARIGSVSGIVARGAFGPDGVQTTVVWAPAPGETAWLTVLDQAARPLSKAAVLTLARSTR